MESLLSKYRGLFSSTDGGDVEGEQRDFGSRWGLFTIIEAMADLHNISINEVFKLGGLEFLNWWAYMTEKRAEEEQQIKDAKRTL